MRRCGDAGSGAAFSAKTPASRATTTPAVTWVNLLTAACFEPSDEVQQQARLESARLGAS
jgi:hypothetical protein